MSKKETILTVSFRVNKMNAMQIALIVAIALLVVDDIAKVATHDYATAFCNLLWIGVAVINLSLNKRNMVLTETVALMMPIVKPIIDAIDEEREKGDEHE